MSAIKSFLTVSILFSTLASFAQVIPGANVECIREIQAELNYNKAEAAKICSNGAKIECIRQVKPELRSAVAAAKVCKLANIRCMNQVKGELRGKNLDAQAAEICSDGATVECMKQVKPELTGRDDVSAASLCKTASIECIREIKGDLRDSDYDAALACSGQSL